MTVLILRSYAIALIITTFLFAVEIIVFQDFYGSLSFIIKNLLLSSILYAFLLTVPVFIFLKLHTKKSSSIHYKIGILLLFLVSTIIGIIIGVSVGGFVYEVTGPNYAQFGYEFEGMGHAIIGAIVGGISFPLITHKLIQFTKKKKNAKI